MRLLKFYIKKIGVPIIISRFLLTLVSYLSLMFLPNPNYPADFFGRGWILTPLKFLDIWIRWDAGWYLSIVTNGYTQNFNVVNTQSNIAYFPMYPLLIKLFSLFAIDFSIHSTLYVLFALFVSNASLFLGLVLIHKICSLLGYSDKAKKTVIWLILLYPYSFFFSAAYSESVFLLFMAATFYFCIKSNWKWAAISGAFLTLTRPLGILVAIPIGIRYLIANKLRVKVVDIALFSIIPLSFLFFLAYGYTLTDDFLAPMHIQAAWGKHFSMPWEIITSPTMWVDKVNQFDILFTAIAVILLLIYILKKQPYFEWALYSLILVSSALFTGQILSNGRYSIIAFPMFMVLGEIVAERDNLKIPIFITFSMIQAILFAGWCRGYFVG